MGGEYCARRPMLKNMYRACFHKLFCIFLAVFIQSCLTKTHKHPTPTYFHRHNQDGTLVDRSSPSYDEVFETKFVETISSLDQNTASLSVSTSKDIENGEDVTVTWKNVVKPSAKDWVGLYCPQNDTARKALDYFFVTDAGQFWLEGYGSRTVKLFNLRTECEFRYYRNEVGGEYTALVARSNLVTFKGGPDQPQHGHLSLTNDPSQMRVMWISGNGDAPTVWYGSAKNKLDFKASATTKTYKREDMCAFPATSVFAFVDPGLIHDALLTGLKPGLRYYYRFGSEKAMSHIYNFTTPLAAGDPTPHKFIVYGDMGMDPLYSPGGQETANRVLEEYRDNHIRHVFHNGDISYAIGWAFLWDLWMSGIQPYSTLVPYMVGVGNHEQDHKSGGSKDPSGAPGNGYHPKWGNYGSDSGGECGVPMFYRFHMPDNGNSVWWYSYDFGLVHFIMMSTEHNFEPNSRQYKWLENDLKKIDRKKTPWVIFGGHRAMYASQDEHGDYIVATNMQRLFENLLHTYKVDLALWAHYHSYERTCKVYKNKCSEDGITHIVIGTAGRNLDQEKFMHKDWSITRLKEYGYGRVTVFNHTAMQFEFVSNKDKSVHDNFYLLK